jgi:hypothetical protein
MKKSLFPYTPPHFIDIAPIWARYHFLAALLLPLIDLERYKDVLSLTCKIRRLIRLADRLEGHNALTQRKLDMLSCKPWRERVLRELGGLRGLAFWEAARERREAKAAREAQSPAAKIQRRAEPAWLYTPARIAESERLKARVRACAKACANPLILWDRVKMDFEGEFRLPSLPRGKRPAKPIKVYTAESITDYDWHGKFFAPETGYGPATVWPAEFHAAMAIEARMLRRLEVKKGVPKNASMAEEKEKTSPLPRRPVTEVITQKQRIDLFGSLPIKEDLIAKLVIQKLSKETPFAFS